MLIDKDLILSGHDISDGGLIVTLFRDGILRNCGIEIGIEEQGAEEQGAKTKSIQILFF